MTVAAAANLVVDPRRYPQLPKGIQVVTGFVTVTGNASGGEMQALLYANPAQDEGFQPYLAITHVAIQVTTALLTNKRVVVQLENDTFERSTPSKKWTLDAVDVAVSDSATSEHGVSDKISFLGRVEKGGLGTIKIATLNTNTSVMVAMISGLISDQPFVPNDFWRA